MNRQVKALVAGCLLVAAAGVPAALPAAEATPAATGWEHSIVLYLLGPNIDGRVGIGGLEGEVNREFFSGSINCVDFSLCAHILWPGKEFGGFFSCTPLGGEKPGINPSAKEEGVCGLKWWSGC